MNYIREIRLSRGLSQNDVVLLLEEYGYSAETALIGILERQDVMPSGELLTAICNVLNCTVKDIENGEEGQEENEAYLVNRKLHREGRWRPKPLEAEQDVAPKDIKYCVYIHTFPDGKFYVGQTKSGNTEQRWCGGRGYSMAEKIFSAILFFGWSNIKHEIVFDGLTKEEADEIEMELIKEYHSVSNGYNTVYEFREARRRGGTTKVEGANS